MLQRDDIVGNLVQTTFDVETDDVEMASKAQQRNDDHRFEVAAALCLSSGIALFVVLLVIFR